MFRSGVSTNDINEYTSGNFLAFSGGAAVIDFFPRYEELEDYSTIKFRYVDDTRNNNRFRTFFPAFALDVQYGDYETFQQRKYDIFNSMYFVNELERVWEDFLLFRVVKCTPNTSRIVAFNNDRHIIRYLAFYGDGVEDRSITGLIGGYRPSIPLYWSFYDLHFVINGELQEDLSKVVGSGFNTIILSNTPTRPGYTLHWYTEAIGGERFDFERAWIGRDITLFGRWVRN